MMGLYVPLAMEANDTAADRDVIRRIAHDYATDATPMAITGEPDFMAWMAVVDELAEDIEYTIRAEVDA